MRGVTCFKEGLQHMITREEDAFGVMSRGKGAAKERQKGRMRLKSDSSFTFVP